MAVGEPTDCSGTPGRREILPQLRDHRLNRAT